MATVTRPTATEVLRVLDSSIWVEYFGGGLLATECGRYAAREREIITPVQVLFEVYRWALRSGGDVAAMEIVSHLESTRFVPVDLTTAVVAAQLGDDHSLAAADAMIYATARLHRCDLVTADADFRGLPGVILLEEQTAGGDQA
jgi:predicted nucleic acid-binding protein